MDDTHLYFYEFFTFQPKFMPQLFCFWNLKTRQGFFFKLSWSFIIINFNLKDTTHFFISNTFISNTRLKWAKNYSKSNITMRLNFRWKFLKNKCVCFNKIIWLSDCNGTWTHNHLVLKQTLNHFAKLASLAKWLSVCLRTKWLCVCVLLEVFKLQISRLFWARGSLTFRQL